MATPGTPAPPPIHITEEHGLTEVQVHCDIELSNAQLESIDSRLRGARIPSIDSRRRQLRWATPSEDSGFWEFRIEFYTLSGRDSETQPLHIMVVGNKVVRTEPTTYRRSRRTTERIRAVVDALSLEHLKEELDCSLTWHSSSDSWPLPLVLPLTPQFPEGSAIQEITGVIGGSSDDAVKFVVDRAGTDPMMFHIWLGFKYELTLSSKVIVEAIAQGVSMLEDINLWGK